MTEGEAKTKYCPLSNTDLCYGGDCMMWRFLRSSITETTENGFFKNKYRYKPREEWHGYCGLADSIKY